MKSMYMSAMLCMPLAISFAIPFNKPRDIIWVTEVQEVYQTVDVIQTVWVSWSPPTTTTSMKIVTVSDFALTPSTPSVQFVTVSDSAPSTSTSSVQLVTVSDFAPSTRTPSVHFVTVSDFAPSTIASSIYFVTVSDMAPSTTKSRTTSSSTPVTSLITWKPVTSSLLLATSSIVPVVTATESSSSSTTVSASVPLVISSNPGMSSGLAASGTTYSGDITYYATGLGSCGITSGYYDHIVAISHVIMDAYNPGNPNNNPLCGKRVMIVYNNQRFPATVVDRCIGCAQGDLDLAEGFFSAITDGDTAAGRIPGVQWSWI